MAIKDITGFIRRFSSTEGMTDATYGFPNGSYNALTAFHGLTAGGGGSDTWAVRSGASGGQAAAAFTKLGTAPTPVYYGGPGLGCQFSMNAGSAAYFVESNNSYKVPFDGGTVMLAVRMPLGLASATVWNDYTSINTTAKLKIFELANQAQTKTLGAYLGYNRGLYGSIDNAATALNTVQCPPGCAREIIVIRSSGTAGQGVSIGIVRGGAIRGEATAGTTTAGDKGYFNYLGDGVVTGRAGPIFDDIALFNSRLSDADVLTAAAEMRANIESTTYAPTIQLDIMGDSITGGYYTTNCASFAHILQSLNPQLFVFPQSIAGADAQVWSEVAPSFVFGSPTGYNIGRRVGLIFLGHNAIPNGQTAAAWIAYINTLADYYLSITGNKPWAMVPIPSGYFADPSTNEALRQQYRTALKASTHLAGVIDTDVLDPSLVPFANSGYATAWAAGSTHRQITVTGSATNLALPGTFTYSTKNIGVDAIHPGPMGHQAIANVLMRATASGFAQAIGAVADTTSARSWRSIR